MNADAPAPDSAASDAPAETGGRYRIEALSRGLRVLRLFDETTTSLKLREIADRADLAMPTAFRVVATLEEEGYLERLPDGAIRPGVAVLALGSAALRGSSLVQSSESPLRRLADATGETVNLGALLGDRVLYLARLRNSDLVTANIQVGSTLPAATTSMGKVLLAYLPPDELRRVMADYDFAAPGGPRAVRSFAQLETALAGIREDGYAVQDEELAAGLRSVAAPVLGRDARPVAAINIAVSAGRYDAAALRGELLERVLATAEEISARVRSS